MGKSLAEANENPSTKGEELVTVSKGDVEVSGGDVVIALVVEAVVVHHVAGESHSGPKA